MTLAVPFRAISNYPNDQQSAQNNRRHALKDASFCNRFSVSVHGTANLQSISLRNIHSFTMEKTAASNNMPEGMGWRVAASILTFFTAIAGIIVWLFFYAGNYNVYQNIAIVAVILIGFVAVMGATWASWSMKQRKWWSEKGDPLSC